MGCGSDNMVLVPALLAGMMMVMMLLSMMVAIITLWRTSFFRVSNHFSFLFFGLGLG
jgi:hypothetical protein